MNDMSKYIAIWMFSVLISSFSQVLLKIAANKKYESRIREYMNPIVITAYGIFFLSTLLTMYALKFVPLTMSPVIESTSYIFVPLFGVLMLKEKISKRRLLGMGIMLIGMLVFAI